VPKLGKYWIPEEILKDSKKFRRIREYVDEGKTYMVDTGNGIMQFTGSELIRTAEAFADFVDATERGDDREIIKALERINAIDCNA